MRSVPLNFDIDRYINPFVPHSRLYLLPKPISWFLGYRVKRRPPIGSILVWWWAFIGGFCSILVIESVFQTERFKMERTPVVIASLGAAAILEFNTIESPLAQPRNCLLGQTIAALIGVGITKLFQLHSNFENLRWIAGALSVGITSAAMGITKTVHPPAGATALLAATSKEITTIGWFLVPLIMLGSSLMLAVACIINNVQREFPMYWWTPVDLAQLKQGDLEKGKAGSKNDAMSGESSWNENMEKEDAKIMIDPENVIVPDWLNLDLEERDMLEVLRLKLHGGLQETRSRSADETTLDDKL